MVSGTRMRGCTVTAEFPVPVQPLTHLIADLAGLPGIRVLHYAFDSKSKIAIEIGSPTLCISLPHAARLEV